MYSGIIPIIKQAAVDAVNATQPVQFVFGKVTSVSPLTIQVTPKLTLGAGNLVICDSLTKKEIDIVVKGNTGTVVDHTHTFADTSTTDGGHSHDVTGTAKTGGSHKHTLSGSTKTASSHTHELSTGTVSTVSGHTHELDGTAKSVSGHSHDVSGTTGKSGGHDHTVEIPVTITIDNSLKKGDSVILARMQGGNKYLVLDKAVDA